MIYLSFEVVQDVMYNNCILAVMDHICGLLVRVPATDPEVPGSIPGTTRYPEK